MGTLRVGLMLVLICWLSSSVNNKLLSEYSSSIFSYRNQDIIQTFETMFLESQNKISSSLWYLIFSFWFKVSLLVLKKRKILCLQFNYHLLQSIIVGCYKKSWLKDFDTENEAWLKLQYWILFSCFICAHQSVPVSS